jgi:hypothetical protein
MHFTLGRWQWFTRVVVVTDLDDPLTEEADMPVSPTSTRSCHSKGTPPSPAIRLSYGSPSSPGLEFADVIKNAPGMKHIVAIWIIDGTTVGFDLSSWFSREDSPLSTIAGTQEDS